MIDLQEKNDDGVYRMQFKILSSNGKRNQQYFYYACDNYMEPIRVVSQISQIAYNNNTVNTTICELLRTYIFN
jgi:transcription elongation factor GreA-like protein